MNPSVKFVKDLKHEVDPKIHPHDNVVRSIRYAMRFPNFSKVVSMLHFADGTSERRELLEYDK